MVLKIDDLASAELTVPGEPLAAPRFELLRRGALTALGTEAEEHAGRDAQGDGDAAQNFG